MQALGQVQYQGTPYILGVKERRVEILAGGPVVELQTELYPAAPPHLGGMNISWLELHPGVKDLRARLRLVPATGGLPYEIAFRGIDDPPTLFLPIGAYRPSYTVELLLRDQLHVYSAAGRLPDLSLGATPVDLPVRIEGGVQASGLIFQEIHLGAVLLLAKPQKHYLRDKYITLYNNTPFSLHVQGVALSMTQMNSDTDDAKVNPTKYLGGAVVPPDFIFAIPSDEGDKTLDPGATILICDQAIDHHAVEPNSKLDLTTADYEIYDNHKLDNDNPNVPNLKKWFSTSWSISLFDETGHKSFYLWKPSQPMQQWLDTHRDNDIVSSYTWYKLSENLILDGVQFAKYPIGLKTALFSPRVDAGFIYPYTTEKFAGHSVRRRVAAYDGARIILQDTNNSKDDFITECTPSPRVLETK